MPKRYQHGAPRRVAFGNLVQGALPCADDYDFAAVFLRKCANAFWQFALGDAGFCRGCFDSPGQKGREPRGSLSFVRGCRQGVCWRIAQVFADSEVSACTSSVPKPETRFLGTKLHCHCCTLPHNARVGRHFGQNAFEIWGAFCPSRWNEARQWVLCPSVYQHFAD
jgi:hypothetical protein